MLVEGVGSDEWAGEIPQPLPSPTIGAREKCLSFLPQSSVACPIDIEIDERPRRASERS